MKESFRRFWALALCVFVLTAGTPFFVFAEPGDLSVPSETMSPTDAEPPACFATGEHVFGSYLPAEGGEHTAVCSLCGGEFRLPCEKAPDAAFVPDGEGRHTAVCALCGGTIAEDCVYADPAVWTDQGNGSHATACTVCGGLKTEPCAYEDAVTLPTATEAGFTTHTCTVCGASFRDTELPAENEREESLLPGDADRNGRIGPDDARFILRLSVLLERTENDELPYCDMDRDGKVSSADARQALRCSVNLEPTPDRHEYAVTVTVAPKCTEGGELTYTCSYCGTQGAMNVPMLGHRYETLSEKAPTCTAAGKRTERCTVCKEKRTVALPAKGHAYLQTSLKEATCTEKGEESLVCSVCGAKKNNVLPALGHDWVEATPVKAKFCARCGKIVSGWTEIDGKSYYFREDGSPMKGTQFLGGLIFNFGKDGASRTGRTGHKAKVAVLGDSIVASIANYNVAKDFDMYGKVSLHVDTIDTKRITPNGPTVLREAVGRDYDVVILMLGVNDLTYDNTWWSNKYREVLRQLKGLVPDAIIYASAIMPINDSKTTVNERMWMVNAKNKAIKSAAEAEGVRYLGTPPGLLNADGQLPYDAASDGIHFGPTYCKIWYDWVKTQLK